MAEGAQGGLGCPSTDGTNESLASSEADYSFLISVCSTAHVVVDGPGHNLGRFSPRGGGRGRACRCWFSVSGLTLQRGGTDCTLFSLIMR